ncbi:hypothetical protein C8J56DRAFT_899656 [Mycena floridula]|nr:hypothetical protein C8J56DRAFT_1116850 [Mycena floridula]KAJ7576544.1 hypothetical protein C8J56DRAFT_899656 [Mycena floridula]
MVDPPPTFQSDNAYWMDKLGPEMQKATPLTKFHLLFSLLVFLKSQLGCFLQIHLRKRDKAGQGQGIQIHGLYPDSSDNRHGVSTEHAIRHWYNRACFPGARKHLQAMIQECASDIAVAESNNIIFYKGGTTSQSGPAEYSDWNDDPDLDDMGPDIQPAFTKDEEFTRNPIFLSNSFISIIQHRSLNFRRSLRKSATNIMPVMLGLFFKINVTGSRVMLLLSNIDLSVSSRTVERLKKRISEDAVVLAVELMHSGKLFYVIFDNINIFLRKFQQRITNKNSMIHATNCCIVAIDKDGIDVEGAESLKKNLAFAFPILIAEFITQYCPGSDQWPKRKEMLDEIQSKMPQDRPLPPKKTDTRPWLLMRVHFGNVVLDPTSLAAHKGILGRTWDVEKLNYAAAKSLIRHSLIACLLFGVVFKDSEEFHSMVSITNMAPTLEEVLEVSITLRDTLSTVRAAEAAKAAKDEWQARNVYFIRNALLFCRFEHAVSHSDAGPVIRVMKYWLLAFCGANQHNYARECAEVLIKWQYETTEPMCIAMEHMSGSFVGNE